MAGKKPDAAVGSVLAFNVDYPIYHIAKGDQGTVKELLGDTHVNLLVNNGGNGSIIAVPLVDLVAPSAPATTINPSGE